MLTLHFSQQWFNHFKNGAFNQDENAKFKNGASPNVIYVFWGNEFNVLDSKPHREPQLNDANSVSPRSF